MKNKKINFKIFCVTLFCLIFSLNNKAQEINMPSRKLFTFNQTRLTFQMGAFAETSIGYNIKTNLVEKNGDETSYTTPIFFGLNTGFNLYSPNSVIDLSANFIFSTSNILEDTYLIIRTEKGYDQMFISRFEFPVFLRLKTGEITSTNSLVFLFGGSYSNYTKSKSIGLDMDNCITSFYSLKFGLAAEFQFFSSDYSRGNLEIMYTHPMEDSFASEYLDLFYMASSIQKKINFGMISLGMNYFFGK